MLTQRILGIVLLLVTLWAFIVQAGIVGIITIPIGILLLTTETFETIEEADSDKFH